VRELEVTMSDEIEKRRAPKKRRRTPKQEVFLRFFARCGIVAMAARQAKISKASHYRWLESDPTYGERFAEAREEAIEYLEELLLKQCEGGNLIAIIFALKAARPAVYRDNYRIEMSGPNGGPISTATVGGVDHYLHLSDEQLERIAATAVDEDELVSSDAELVTPTLPASDRLRIAGPHPNGDGELDDSDNLDDV
jgi:hypothetical protein